MENRRKQRSEARRIMVFRDAGFCDSVDTLYIFGPISEMSTSIISMLSLTRRVIAIRKASRRCLSTNSIVSPVTIAKNPYAITRSDVIPVKDYERDRKKYWKHRSSLKQLRDLRASSFLRLTPR